MFIIIFTGILLLIIHILLKVVHVLERLSCCLKSYLVSWVKSISADIFTSSAIIQINFHLLQLLHASVKKWLSGQKYSEMSQVNISTHNNIGIRDSEQEYKNRICICSRWNKWFLEWDDFTGAATKGRMMTSIWNWVVLNLQSSQSHFTVYCPLSKSGLKSVNLFCHV